MTFFVARMERERNAGQPIPDYAALHPGYMFSLSSRPNEAVIPAERLRESRDPSLVAVGPG
jgi:hypothetical protein